MRTQFVHSLSLTVVFTALCAGCATRTAPSGAQSSPIPAAGDSASASPWRKFTASISNGSRKVASAVKPKAHVVKAQDPTSLGTPTGKLGADIYVAAAKIHESKGDVDGAAAQYDQALKINGNDLAALLGYGRLLDRQKKFTEATLHYERATKAHPTSAAAWNDAGLCFSRRAATDPAMTDKAIAAVGKAIELKPEKKLYRNNIAAVLASAGRESEAFSHLAAVHDPATAHYNMGYLLNQQNDTAAASRHFAEALRHNPQLAAAKAYLDQLGRQQNAVAESQPVQYVPRKLTVPGRQIAPVTSERSVILPTGTPRSAPTRPAIFESSATVAPNDVAPVSAELTDVEGVVATAGYNDAPEPPATLAEIEAAEVLDAPLPK